MVACSRKTGLNSVRLRVLQWRRRVKSEWTTEDLPWFLTSPTQCLLHKLGIYSTAAAWDWTRALGYWLAEGEDAKKRNEDCGNHSKLTTIGLTQYWRNKRSNEMVMDAPIYAICLGTILWIRDNMFQRYPNLIPNKEIDWTVNQSNVGMLNAFVSCWDGSFHVVYEESGVRGDEAMHWELNQLNGEKWYYRSTEVYHSSKRIRFITVTRIELTYNGSNLNGCGMQDAHLSGMDDGSRLWMRFEMCLQG